MKTLRCLSAYVDFSCADSLSTLARKISTQMFAGVEFVGADSGVWDEVPAVRLASRFLGLNVELGGTNGCYTLQIDTPEFPWEMMPDESQKDIIADMSDFVAHLLRQIPGVQIIDA